RHIVRAVWGGRGGPGRRTGAGDPAGVVHDLVQPGPVLAEVTQDRCVVMAGVDVFTGRVAGATVPVDVPVVVGLAIGRVGAGAPIPGAVHAGPARDADPCATGVRRADLHLIQEGQHRVPQVAHVVVPRHLHR